MLFSQSMRIGSQLVARALRVAWQSKQLWWYSAYLLLVNCGIFAAWLGVARLLGRTDTSWYLLIDPQYYVTFSLSFSLIKNAFLFFVYAAGSLVAALLVRALLLQEHKLLPQVTWRYCLRIVAWSGIQGLFWLLLFYGLRLCMHWSCRAGVFTIAGLCMLLWLLVMPWLVARTDSLARALWGSTVYVWRNATTIFWSWCLLVLILVLLSCSIAALSLLLAKVVGMLFSLSPIESLVPFALCGGFFGLIVFFYMVVVWNAWIVSLYHRYVPE